MTAEDLLPLINSSSRIGASATARRLPPELLGLATACDPTTALVVAHHCAGLAHEDSLDVLDDERLAGLACYGAASWPVGRALTVRLIKHSNQALVNALKVLGPEDVCRPMYQDSLADGLCVQILAHAEEFPSAWVAAAEGQHSHQEPQVAFHEAARRARWVPDLTS